MNVNAAPPLTGLARRLVQDGILEEQVARSAVQDARTRKLHFVAHVVESGLANSMRVAESASDEFGTPLLDLSAFNLDTCPKSLVDVKLIEKHRTIPLFKRGNRPVHRRHVGPDQSASRWTRSSSIPAISTEAVLVDETSLGHARSPEVPRRRHEDQPREAPSAIWTR
jgi:type IV pilus assembly protein PilB